MYEKEDEEQKGEEEEEEEGRVSIPARVASDFYFEKLF